MKSRSSFGLLQQGDLNFILTNAIPRKWLTRIVRRVSRSERPWVRAAAIGLWRLFADVDLSDAQTTTFRSMHECFTRRLRPGARPIDPDPAYLVSPCDGIVGACGAIRDDALLQAKGSEYTLVELLGDGVLAERFRDGCYVTLRLTSGMYHRFHSPGACTVEQVRYFPGELWNVNPPTLKRIRKLFCRNERAVLQARVEPSADVIALVPVGAVLVGSIRLSFLDATLDQHYRGPRTLTCRAAFGKAQEMGWFEHGSTIIVLAPRGFALPSHITPGVVVRMGTRLLALPVRPVDVNGMPAASVRPAPMQRDQVAFSSAGAPDFI